MQRRGFTMAELIISAGLSTMILLFISWGYITVLKQVQSAKERFEMMQVMAEFNNDFVEDCSVLDTLSQSQAFDCMTGAGNDCSTVAAQPQSARQFVPYHKSGQTYQAYFNSRYPGRDTDGDGTPEPKYEVVVADTFWEPVCPASGGCRTGIDANFHIKVRRQDDSRYGMYNYEKSFSVYRTLSNKPQRSCRSLYSSDNTLSSGTYFIDPDGAGGQCGFPVYCDMTDALDGGERGWGLFASAPEAGVTYRELPVVDQLHAGDFGMLDPRKIALMIEHSQEAVIDGTHTESHNNVMIQVGTDNTSMAKVGFYLRLSVMESGPYAAVAVDGTNSLPANQDPCTLANATSRPSVTAKDAAWSTTLGNQWLLAISSGADVDTGNVVGFLPVNFTSPSGPGSSDGYFGFFVRNNGVNDNGTPGDPSDDRGLCDLPASTLTSGPFHRQLRGALWLR